ncbi:MAG: DUF1775 domain-containing protein [Microcella sp.]|uniref:YcnI family copper-binding membrane protein n=1 Tax=Microcella sp. TaxID=1913979 RepID=UPI0024CBA009|nr:DUF1775 domain-containing protein [Microcella sp.]UYN84638.1 MAG: DUF1775 domain-containing protein [Microcella sp.]
MKKRTSLTVALLTAGVLALAVPSAAHAHVTATASSTGAGSYTVVTFSVPHGCEAAPTQVVTIDIPESVPNVTPTVNASWSVEKVFDGPEGAERVTQVVYTSLTGGLPSDLRDTFALSLRLPEGAAGDVVAFPVTQTCTEGSVVWEGDDVPSVTLTAATGDAHGDGTAESHSDEAEHAADNSEASAPAANEGDVVARVLGIVGVIVGIVGIALAIAARRSTAAKP